MTRQFFYLIIALLTASCSMTPNIVPNPVPIGKEFSVKATRQKPQPILWWQDFNDKRLDTLIKVALRNNKNLYATWTKVLQAAALARQARADLYPSLSAGVSASRSRSLESHSYSGAYGASLTASYEVDLWGKVRNSRRVKIHDMLASAENYEAAAITLSAQVASIWYQLAENHHLKLVLDKQLNAAEQTLKLINLRFDSGEAGASDVLQQRQTVESIKGEKHLLVGNRKVLKNALSVLLGQSPLTSKLDNVRPTFIDLAKVPKTGMPYELLNRRPDLRGLWQQAMASERAVAVAMANRLPQLTLSPELGSSSTIASKVFDNWALSILGSLTTSLFNAGKLKAEVKRTKAVVAERLSNYTQAALVAIQEVEDALAQEDAQQKYIVSLWKQNKSSRQILDQVKKEYNAGEKNYLDILNAQTALFRLERTLVSARRQQIDYRINLHKALAGGFMSEIAAK
jgi:NodT family efflux transporter outer membrane factor (OMF) lipoprotein